MIDEKNRGRFDARDREKSFSSLTGDELDILVIGGGITGAGILRDAAMRGLKTALIEKNDFSWGTSSRSSKLIHGGLRYLERMDLKLVFESQSERRILRYLAPNLVTPIPFLFPVFGDSKLEFMKIRVGLWLYDILALFRNYRLHTPLRKKDIALLEPFLIKDSLVGGILYYDAFTDDIRLTIESIKSGVRAGGTAINRAEAVGFELDGNRITGVEILDGESGEKITARPKLILAACGPWSDMLLEKLPGNRKKLLRPTKGAHLILPRKRIRNRYTVVMPEAEGSRILFCIPWGDVVIAGTTDTDYGGHPDDVHLEPDDAKYILKQVNNYFPSAALTEKDIVSGYAGLRPLLNQEGISESKVTREHGIVEITDNMIMIVGGKLTTYRKMASEILDKALEKTGVKERFGRCSTETLPLVESYNLQDERGRLNDFENIVSDETTRKYLRETYGTGASEVIANSGGDSGLLDRILPDLPALKVQIVYAVKEESCLHLDDFFLRRTSLFLKDRRLGLAAAGEAALIMGKVLGWSSSRRKNEVSRLEEVYNTSLGWLDEYRD